MRRDLLRSLCALTLLAASSLAQGAPPSNVHMVDMRGIDAPTGTTAALMSILDAMNNPMPSPTGSMGWTGGSPPDPALPSPPFPPPPSTGGSGGGGTGTGGSTAIPCPTSVVLYIHGFNTDANAATAETNQFASQLGMSGYTGPILGISWDSQSTPNFRQGMRAADMTAKVLLGFIQKLRERCPETKINIVTYSLGARVALGMLQCGGCCHSLQLIAPAVDNDCLGPKGEFNKAAAAVGSDWSATGGGSTGTGGATGGGSGGGSTGGGSTGGGSTGGGSTGGGGTGTGGGSGGSTGGGGPVIGHQGIKVWFNDEDDVLGGAYKVGTGGFKMFPGHTALGSTGARPRGGIPANTTNCNVTGKAKDDANEDGSSPRPAGSDKDAEDDHGVYHHSPRTMDCVRKNLVQ